MRTSWIRLLHGSSGILACVALLLSVAAPANASDEMGVVNVVKGDPSAPTTLFAGANRGLFKSIDAGATWAATGLTQPTVALAITPVTPTIVYAGTQSGLFKSVDGGTTWSTAGVTGTVCSIEVDPALPTTIYASTCTQIVKSVDGGATWSGVGPAGVTSYSGAIAAGPPTVLYGTDGLRVFSSPDGGTAWHVTDAPTMTSSDPSYVPLATIFVGGLSIDPMTSTTVYAVSSGWFCDNDGCATTGAIAKSADGGAGWFFVDRIIYYGSWVSPSVGVSPVAIDPLAPEILYAAWRVTCDQFDVNCGVGDHWIAKSRDGGGTWRRVSDLAASVLWFDPLTPTVLHASTDDGVVQSTDGGVTWTGTAPPPTPSTDASPPETSISSAADGTGTQLANDAATLSTSMTLSFTGTDDRGVSRFECRLDSVGFSACASPRTYNALPLGRHTFEVRAVDAAGNVDATPARHTWTVDAAPDTTITGSIDGKGKSIPNGGNTTSDTMTFRFSGTDNGAVARFECRLDAGTFTACASPVTYTRVPGGARTFQVRAIDNNSFPDPSPAVFTWTALRPKLSVTTLTPPARGAIGQTISVPHTVRNTGQAPAGSFVVQFHLSADPVLDAGDVVLGQRTVNSLAVGGSSTATTSLRLPDTTAAGRYYLVAVADALNQQEAAQGSNKIAVAGPFDVAPHRPELALTVLTMPAYGVVNQTMTLMNAVRNSGLAPAGSFVVRFYLSRDSVPDGGDRALGDRAVGALAPGAQSSASTSLRIPAGTVVGQYHVIAVVDAGGTQTELDEANNIVASAPFNVLAQRPTDGSDTGECGAARPLGWVRPPACAPPNPGDGGDGEELQFPEQLRPEPAAVRRLF